MSGDLSTRRARALDAARDFAALVAFGALLGLVLFLVIFTGQVL